ncbi:family 43 glycosylhydrolase [Gaoshiqia sediminis]|uniref:Family 43 glycosylhydrolase n=1 Tax=Gaoshiqia sediminis TaxID=2986998 RepID=A0AA42C766_9BACT|nr:family 43 glycosylhydrolase [Gaoshiqia sediminis]MCW0483274.1 family 43 glycosylhydrolase [Gaoshiqia sediminis]
MKKRLPGLLFLLMFLSWISDVYAWEGMPTPKLHVDGRYLKDPHGNTVNLHGFAQTYSPWFNERGTQWTNYDVNGCLAYNQGLIDDILDAGWKMNFLRLHMDPYWSNTPGCTPDGHELPNCFNEDRFRKYLDEVFIPMAEYAISKGLYVIMRPPGVSPEVIGVEDDYNYAQYLMTVWDIVSKHPKIKNSDEIMLELANEPVRIRLADGTEGSNAQAHFDVLKQIFQPIVNKIRENGFHNVLWIPGSGYQSQYKGFALNPIEGENIGYAVHVYPGWFGSADGYEVFKQEWDEQVKPVADFAPIVITEMDWADEKYESSWGKGHTGTAGGDGFGANFKKIMDETGNVSWLLFTSPDLLAQFTGEPPAEGEPYTFLNDPEACPWPVYHWYQEYANENYPRPDFQYQSQSDNGDGTYSNPLIFADFPDPDVIRVGDVYYMVSTTMHIFPGATILKSFDLVNWEYCSNPLEKIESSACFDLDGCDRYGHGQWATSLKYNNGTYYLLFTTLEEGSYLLTATDPEGPWEKQKLADTFYDPGLFFDEDGKTYVAYGINTLKIAELDEDFSVVPGSAQDVYTYTVKEGLEGSHLYKINGYYYIYATYGGWPAYQVALRSTNIYGPYEEKLLLDDDNIHQGALVETQTGEWWTVLFYDKGAFGRLPNLQPVTWVDNWPEIGVDGKGVTTYTKPNVGRDYPVKVLPTNDNFRNYKPGMQWGWNHNPDNTKWSLTERPDYLRLETVSVVNDLTQARNTLTQRIFGYPSDLDKSFGTIKMDIENMLEGDVAGLAVFQDPYAYVGVKVIDGQKVLVMMNDGTMVTGAAIEGIEVYLRAVASYNTSMAGFYFSLDNETYTKIGTDLDMKFDLSVFTGNKFSIFNFATVQTGGYVDLDWFSTEEFFSEETFYDDAFEGYSEESLTLTDLIVEGGDVELLTGGTASLSVQAVFADGRTEDVSIGATYDNPKPEIIQIVNGNIIADADGEVTVTVTYQGGLGNPVSRQFTVTSSTFPLTSGLFNPSIYANGTFDETTATLVTGQYGFGGWKYDAGIDLSDYKYLVVRLEKAATCSPSFRLFDSNSYWDGAAEYDFGNRTEMTVPLYNMYKKDTDTKLDPSHIYIIGFWTLGGCPVEIAEVFLTNTIDEGTIPTDVSEIPIRNHDETELVDVYSVMGIKLRSDVIRKNATKGLPAGVYIVGNQKVVEIGLGF